MDRFNLFLFLWNIIKMKNKRSFGDFKNSILFLGIFFFSAFYLKGQHTYNFDGQILVQSNLGLKKGATKFIGLRYLPEFTYSKKLDSLQSLTFEVAGNLSNSRYSIPNEPSKINTSLDPYRIWARYLNKNFEIRLGLQKIDFGSAQLLRPLQWFNQIDPRDPLSLTNGVYGLLVRYYYKNNSNIWLWGLYGNEKLRGLDALPTTTNTPEFGGRYQSFIPKGELAISYHYRTANSEDVLGIQTYSKNPEHRIGFDSKWDLGIGLWIESTFIHREKDLGLFTNQFLLNLGIDYTFNLGNGLNFAAEHLLSSLMSKDFDDSTKQHISALRLSYPLTFYSSINGLFYQQWKNNQQTLLLNYKHQFKYFSAYLIAYYNPEETQGIQQNEIVTSLKGPGIQLLVTYNH